MRIPERFLPALLAVAAAIHLLAPAVLHAQTRSLSWTETTKIEAPGSLGLILRLTGGGRPIEARSALHLQGQALIQEFDNTAFVTDLSAGLWISVDHDARTYTSLTLNEMYQLTEQIVESLRASSEAASAEAGASREELERSREEARAEIRFRMSAESTGQRQRIGSYDATQHFIIAEYEVTSVPEGVEETPEGGALYYLTELWQTADLPTEQQLYDEWARMVANDPRLRETVEELALAAGDVGDVMATSLSAWDPNVGAGLAEVAAAIDEINGTTVRSVLTAAVVPLGVTPDRTALLAWEPTTMGAVLGNAAGVAARQAVADAARSIGGLFGGRSRPEPEPEPEAAPAVQPLFRVITTRADLSYRESSEDVLGALRARIADYRQITYEELSRQLP